MDAYEATKIVFERIQKLDPQNASKIMGFLLIQDHGEKEMIRLAFGPESSIQAVISRVKLEIFLVSPNTSLTPSLNSPRQSSCSSVPSRLKPNPISVGSQSSNSASSWTNSRVSFSDLQSLDDLISPVPYNGSSYPSAAASGGAAAAPLYTNGEFDLIEELQRQDQLSFSNDVNPQIGRNSSDFFYCHKQDLASSPTGNDAFFFPPYSASGGGGGGFMHRRSCSVTDDDLSAGFGWKPCLFYAGGFCKNGTTCRFLHGGDATAGACKPELFASTNFRNFPQISSNKCLNFLQQFQSESPRSPTLDGMHKFMELGINGLNNPSSRQIYLTFPADSTFKEEDVSNYFSNFGPVQDVRIPYQQKRMFGFVTFDYPETVKLILAKGNPHFVCDARVLVKPYKEKGKIPDKHRKAHQPIERGDFAGFSSPTGMETRDPFDLQLGARIFHNTQDMLWRKKLEDQVNLQEAIELQNRRLMNLRLIDIKRNNHHRTLSTGAVISSPTYSPTFFDQKLSNGSTRKDEDFVNEKENNNGQENAANESDLHERYEHNLPNSPFGSPKAVESYAVSTDFFDNGLEARKCGVVSTPSTNNNLITGMPSYDDATLIKSPSTSSNLITGLLEAMEPLECRHRDEAVLAILAATMATEKGRKVRVS